MAGYENIRDANEKRTPEERRELAKKAGKASGQARRRKADLPHMPVGSITSIKPRRDGLRR
mgnify:CR=1 FL=1